MSKPAAADRAWAEACWSGGRDLKRLAELEAEFVAAGTDTANESEENRPRFVERYAREGAESRAELIATLTVAITAGLPSRPVVLNWYVSPGSVRPPTVLDGGLSA